MGDPEQLKIEAPPQKTLRELLCAKYSLPHHVLLWEVRNSTGFNSDRAADAIAISLYVSRGQSMTGFEIKESRSDWLSELRRPEKAEAIGRFCDFFFLVTADDKIAKLEEIPQPWGWLARTGSKLKVMKKAEKLVCSLPDRAMLCALIYATKEHYLRAGLQSVNQEVDRLVDERHSYVQSELERARKDYRELHDKVQKFERIIGRPITWRNSDEIPKIAEAVRAVLNGEASLQDHRRDLAYLLDRAVRIKTAIEDELKGLAPDQEASK